MLRLQTVFDSDLSLRCTLWYVTTTNHFYSSPNFYRYVTVAPLI